MEKEKALMERITAQVEVQALTAMEEFQQDLLREALEALRELVWMREELEK